MSTFPSRDGTTLHELVWRPSGAARGTVALVHGYGEHIARYDEVGRGLAERGFVVHGLDLRGHGQSGGARGHVQRFGEYLDDVAALLERARGAGPTFLLGHSMGGLVSLAFVLREPRAVDALVLSSPYLRLKLPVPAVKVWAGKLSSKLVPKLALPSGLKGVDVARDPEIARAYDVDPLNNKNATARWFTESTAAQEEVLRRAGEIQLPVLVMHGGDDRVADPEASRQLFAAVGSKDKTLRILPGQFHEIFNDLPDERRKTIADVATWIEAHASAAADAKVAR